MKSAHNARRGKISGAITLSTFVILMFGLLASPAWAQRSCGCMDVVLVVDDTGSMGPAIANVKAGLASIIASGVGGACA